MSFSTPSARSTKKPVSVPSASSNSEIMNEEKEVITEEVKFMSFKYIYLHLPEVYWN